MKKSLATYAPNTWATCKWIHAGFFWALILLVIPGKWVFAQESVAFYIVAHQDDWQLFMAKNAYADVTNPKQKTVFITLTAGDAGLGNGGTGLIPYYQARDNGSRLSIKFLADIASVPDRSESTQYVYANTHRIFQVQYKHTKSYYLRLPEGNGDGAGFVKTNNQSLKRLREGTLPKITAVDSSASYQGWADLVQTIQRIVVAESAGYSYVTLNVPETDDKLNPGDHSDHRLVGELVAQATKDLTCLKQYSWLGYFSSSKPLILTNDELLNCASVFVCNIAGNIQGGYRSNWDVAHKQWIGKGQARVTTIEKDACVGVVPNVDIAADQAMLIRNKETGKVLEITGSALGAGAFLQQNANKEGSNQLFFFKNTPEKLWTIIAKHSGLALDAHGGGVTPGTKVWQFRVNGTTAQNWLLEQADDSTFFVKNQKSNLYLEASVNGAEVSLQGHIGHNAQRWYIIPGSKPLNPPTDSMGSIATAVKEITDKRNIWKIFPNPLQYATEVNFSLTKGYAGEVNVSLYTLGGQILSQENYPRVSEQQTAKFMFPPLTHGIYLLELIHVEEGQTYRNVYQLVR